MTTDMIGAIQYLKEENNMLKDAVCSLDKCNIKFDWCGCPAL